MKRLFRPIRTLLLSNFIIIAFTLSIGVTLRAQHAMEWENVSVISLNKEEPHSTLMVYPDRSQASTFDRAASEWFMSLNGPWKFKWSANPASRPVDFYTLGFDDSAWGHISVPSNWELQGHGSPVYSNIRYPFDESEGKVPHDDNPVGSYKRSFELTEQWQNKQLYLSFDGVSSAFYVWVNGQKVGYSQGGRTLAEFDITDYVKEGTNQLAVEVYKWSDASYLEDQDFWRLAGIFRDVYIMATPKVHLRDFEITASLDDDYKNGVFALEGEILNQTNQVKNLRVEVVLLDAQKQRVLLETTSLSVSEQVTTFRIAPQQIPNVNTWNAEHPYLYDAYISVYNGNDLISVIPKKVGFRRVEISNGRILVNGVAVRLRGVNRHEHTLKSGHSITKQDMLNDIRLMKQHNVNAVRTSHYPNHPMWYDLMDQYGFYVIDEGNIETHGFGTNTENRLANDPAWQTPILDRVKRMIYRDRNHPSVIMWSLGNESGDGPNMTAVYDYVRKTDPSRPYHYEGTTMYGGLFNADIGSFMYATPERVVRFTQEKPEVPLILCEYTHAMGNSNGHLAAYWDLIYADNNFQGAFVWDWMDQGLMEDVPESFQAFSGQKNFIAYGGFYENPQGIDNDGNFNMNGVVGADLSVRPGLRALKYYHQYVSVEALDLQKGQFLVKNRYDFSRLDQKVSGRWQLLEDGKVVSEASLDDLAIEAGEQKSLNLPLPEYGFKSDHEYHLTFVFENLNEDEFLPKGFEIAWEQFELPFGQRQALGVPTSNSGLQPSVNGNHFVVAGKDFHVVFDRVLGRLESYHLGKEQILLVGPELDFWRALTDNDRAAIRSNKHRNMMVWRAAGFGVFKEFLVDGKRVQPDQYRLVRPVDSIQVYFGLDLPAVDAEASMTYTVYADGSIDVDITYNPGEAGKKYPLIPRFGSRMEFAPGFDQMHWYGRGEGETYTDRKTEKIGIYSSSVEESRVNYARPQENGYKTDLRWIAFTNEDGMGLRFMASDELLSASASHYNREDMLRSAYHWQMEARSSTYVNIDHKQMGVGGINSWSPRALPEPGFRVINEPMRYGYRIQPVYPKP